ncbi:hypothetical protein SCUCBS95973_001751 [Sporothrix curviconia]|uniref:Pentatricopeptide repeat protein n=1 Tax=Sporothrix curviconia TaxID=1260050 RepID=A0ABP0B126_9PEZI
MPQRNDAGPRNGRRGTQGGYALHYKFGRTADGAMQLKAKRATEARVEKAKKRLQMPRQKRKPNMDALSKGKSLKDPRFGQQGFHTRRLELRPAATGKAELVETATAMTTTTTTTTGVTPASDGTSWRLKKLVASKGGQKKPTVKYVMAQWRRVQRTTQPEDMEAARQAFWGWRASIEDTRQLLKRGELPRQTPEGHLLWRVLGPRRSGENSVEGTTERIRQVKEAWEALPRQQQTDAWPDLINEALRSGPHHAYVLFMATFDAATMPLYVAEDTIHFLASSATTANMPSYSSSLSGDDLFALLRHAFETQPMIQELSTQQAQKAPRLLLQQATIFHFTRILGTPDAAWHLYRLLVDHGHALYKDTRLQIAWQLARSPQLTHRMRALEILQEALTSTNLDINSPQSASVCTAILTVHENGGTNEGAHEPRAQDGAEDSVREPAVTPAEMFEVLLRCGLEPNLIMYTTLIRGLCLRHELRAAQQVLELMVKNQIDPDDTVYSIMMNGAKTCGDVPALQRVATSAAAHDVRHPYVWNDFLQAIYQRAHAEVMRQPSSVVSKQARVIPAFPLMVQAFTRIFVRTPLETLLPGVFLGGHSRSSETADATVAAQRWEFMAQLEPTVLSLPQLPPTAMVEPTSPALATMVLAYIQSLSKPYDVISFYSHLRRLLQARDPTAVRLVQSEGTRIHDIVIMALCKHEGMLRATLDVVGDMLRDATAALEGERQGQGQGQGQDADKKADDTLGHGHPPPSIYTWSILLNGFMVHRQARQGERILKMMRDRGVEPNIVTWNSLLAGYARAQRPQETARALLRLERAGFEPDDYTIRAFSYLMKKTSALQFLEDQRVAEAASGSNVAASVSGIAAANLGTGSVAGTSAANAVAPFASADTSYAEDSSLWGDKPATVADLHNLESEVEVIAKMMDEEQRDGSGNSTV